jgi:hypothetical protein
VRKADNLPPSCAVVTKSGNLNFLEPSGALRACNGTAFGFLHNVYLSCIFLLLHTPFLLHFYVFLQSEQPVISTTTGCDFLTVSKYSNCGIYLQIFKILWVSLKDNEKPALPYSLNSIQLGRVFNTFPSFRIFLHICLVKKKFKIYEFLSKHISCRLYRRASSTFEETVPHTGRSFSVRIGFMLQVSVGKLHDRMDKHKDSEAEWS